MNEQMTPQEPIATESANGRFKDSFSSWFWSSMIAAAMVHFGFFAYLEFAEPPDVSLNGEPPEVINLPPDVVLPPPPEAIARPATPVVAPVDIETDITIAPTTFESSPSRICRSRPARWSWTSPRRRWWSRIRLSRTTRTPPR